jgi:hypothetical protein
MLVLLYLAEDQKSDEALQAVDDTIQLWTAMERKAAKKQSMWQQKEIALIECCRQLTAEQKAADIEHQLQESLFQALHLRGKLREDSKQGATTPRQLAEARQSAREQQSQALRIQVQELEEELSMVSRKMLDPVAARAGEADMKQRNMQHEDMKQVGALTNWRSHRLSVNNLMDAKLVQKIVGPSTWTALPAAELDEAAYESSGSARSLDDASESCRSSLTTLPDVILSRRKSTGILPDAQEHLSEARRYSAAIDMLLLKELEKNQELELHMQILAEAQQENSTRAAENEALRVLTDSLTQKLADLTALYREMELEQERDLDDSQNSALRHLTSQLSRQLHDMTGTSQLAALFSLACSASTCDATMQGQLKMVCCVEPWQNNARSTRRLQQKRLSVQQRPAKQLLRLSHRSITPTRRWRQNEKQRKSMQQRRLRVQQPQQPLWHN